MINIENYVTRDCRPRFKHRKKTLTLNYSRGDIKTFPSRILEFNSYLVFSGEIFSSVV